MRKPIPVRVRCERCGDVHVALADITIRVCVETKFRTSCFRCPQCGAAVATESGGQLLEDLTRLGVHTEEWHLPGELHEPRPGGPRFTWDDVLDFHLFLDDDAHSPQPR